MYIAHESEVDRFMEAAICFGVISAALSGALCFLSGDWGIILSICIMGGGIIWELEKIRKMKK